MLNETIERAEHILEIEKTDFDRFGIVKHAAGWLRTQSKDVS